MMGNSQGKFLTEGSSNETPATTTWFDLPAEVKRIIFSMVADVDSIIYVPRDRRRKVDTRHIEAHHFHDLLLVSKTFVTPEEFAFAILGTAKLKLHSYNELRRLTTEIQPSFKESIRRIHLSRKHTRDGIYFYPDSFSGFGTIDKTLSTQMPQLLQVYISWPGHCAQIALCEMPHTVSSSAQDPLCSSVVGEILSGRSQKEMSASRILHRNSLSHVAASFVGQRDTTNPRYHWTRPMGWIRRLVSYAEDNHIEVILQMNVCVAYVQRHHRWAQDIVKSCCWSMNEPFTANVAYWQTHVEAEMSSKDYILRVEHNGRKFTYHQKLAYDLLHSPASRGANYWLNMVEDIKPRLHDPSFCLPNGDGF